MTLKHVTIVGGGSAGWITAAYMNAVLNNDTQKTVEFTVIESPTRPRISVGEATVPTISHLLQTLKIDENDFMGGTGATFKQGIKFVNWLKQDDHTYYHPFDRRETGATGYRATRDWLKSDRSIPFAETVSVQPRLCDMNYSPKLAESGRYESPLTYAYHLDAERFADYLCTYAKSNGVRHIEEDVVEVTMAEDDRISAVITSSGKAIKADLFIDCTGFSSLLIGKKLGVGFKDYSQWLLCDRAVTMQIPYEHHYPGQIRPYTLSTALSAGWVWDIGLQDRRGVGYVYASAFLDDTSAEQALREYEGKHSADISCRTLKFSVGRREQFWVSNCVAIGLSAAFVEPLESTGINMIEFAAITLAEHFPYNNDFKPLAARYNKIMSNRFNDALSFINLHYCLSQRSDSAFWKEVQCQEHIMETVQERLDLWQLKRPSEADFDNHFILFNHINYEYILNGMNFMMSETGDHNIRPATVVPEVVLKNIELGATHLIPHDTWLQQNLGMKQYPTGK
ncbi:MAG: tryptophan halogenase [Alphaproteobacteria bacterium]|nr:MAG: tryptophan halogenase [Alphaproteobacteria bacterium]